MPASPDTARGTRASLDGLVVANHGLHVVVQDDDGRLRHCTRRRSVVPIVAGDRVAWEQLPDGSGIITACRPRTSLLSRPGHTGVARPIAANIDRLVIVTAVIPFFDERLIDRYLVAAELAGIQALIIVNKIDLFDATQCAAVDVRLSVYRRLGYDVLLTSVVAQQHIGELLDRLTGHSSVLLGPSGVGKSSLIHTLLPDIDIRIAALSAATGHGTHTTTTTMLYDLPGGGNIIDSPGTRDFTVGDIDAALVAKGFIEINALTGQCKFNDCLHRTEHGCAVKAAVEAGLIHSTRYQSYLDMLNGPA